MGLIIFSDAEKQNRNLLLLVRSSLMIANVFGIFTLAVRTKSRKAWTVCVNNFFRLKLKFAIKLLSQFPSKSRCAMKL